MYTHIHMHAHTNIHTYIHLRRHKEFEANMVRYEVQILWLQMFIETYFFLL